MYIYNCIYIYIISFIYFNLEKFPQLLCIYFYDTGIFEEFDIPSSFLIQLSLIWGLPIVSSWSKSGCIFHPGWDGGDVCVLLRVSLLEMDNVHCLLLVMWFSLLSKGVTLSLYSYSLFSRDYWKCVGRHCKVTQILWLVLIKNFPCI